MTASRVASGSLVWAAVAAGVSIASLPSVTADARWLVAMCSIVFPGAAVMASVAVRRGHARIAGLLLIASAATPTYFAWVLNIPALAIGVTLAAWPRAVSDSRGGTVLTVLSR